MKHLSDYSAEDLEALARADVARALAEDVGSGDLTAALVDGSRRAKARILARESAVICGRPWVEAAVLACDPQARLTWHVAEGQRCAANQVVLEIEGRAQALLTAERTALNFLQLLSGVATTTREYVRAVHGISPNPRGCQVLDTRKTLPGLRQAQKYVACDRAFQPRLEAAICVEKNEGDTLIGQAVRKRRREADVAEAYDAGQMMQRHLEAGFPFNLDAQRVVLQSQVGVGQSDVKGVQQLHRKVVGRTG